MKCCVAWIALCIPSLAQAPSHEVARLTPLDLAPRAHFGWSVDLDGDTLAVSSPLEPTGGAVYVYDRSGPYWLQTTRLDIGTITTLGYSLALAGDRMVAGDVLLNTGTPTTGGAVVFERNAGAWSEVARFFPSLNEACEFGLAVTLDGSRIAVGAPTGSPSQSGAVYVFVRNGTTWTEEARLIASDATSGARFGASISLSGNTLIAGSPGGISALGAAYVFVHDGSSWSQQVKLTASGGVAPLQFGTAVVVRGDQALVGAPRDGLAGEDRGSVRVFQRQAGTWSETAALVQSDAPTAYFAAFGSALDTDGARLVVGAPKDYSIGGPAAGSVYVFANNAGSWVPEAKIQTRDCAMFDWFGAAVAVRGDTVVGGAWSDEGLQNSENGSARVFQLAASTGTGYCHGLTRACPCAQSAVPETLGNGCRNSLQFSAGGALWAFGRASVAQDDLVLRAAGMPHTAPMTLVQGTAWAHDGWGDPFGDGLRCTGGALIRLVTRDARAGDAIYPEPGDVAISVRGAVPPSGGTRYYQAIYRNSVEFCTSAYFNGTNGLAVVWGP